MHHVLREGVCTVYSFETVEIFEMELYLFNLTDITIIAKPKGSNNTPELSILPSASAALTSDKAQFTLSSAGEERKYDITMSKAFPFRYNLSIPKDCPWRIYRDKPSKKRIDILVLPKRKLDAFLSTLPDSTRLNSICLPGTHETMAFYGWPISQCQSETTPLSVQLADGIRVLDIRLAIQNGRLVTFHGQFPERTAFQSILGDLHAFLTSPTSAHETVVISIKQEDFATNSPTEFSALVHGELEAGPGGFGMWFLENRIPTLGEVRGKAILFSRFGDGTGWNGGLEGMGIHPTTWPDSAKQGFTWTCKDVTVRTQDWYNISSFLSIPEKTQVSEQLLLPPPVGTEQSVLSITYFSAASIPLATPSTVATGFGWPRFGMGTEGVNSRISKFLLAALKEDRVLRAWTLMDFYNKPIGSDVVPLLVECNFRGRPGGVPPTV